MTVARLGSSKSCQGRHVITRNATELVGLPVIVGAHLIIIRSQQSLQTLLYRQNNDPR